MRLRNSPLRDTRAPAGLRGDGEVAHERLLHRVEVVDDLRARPSPCSARTAAGAGPASGSCRPPSPAGRCCSTRGRAARRPGRGSRGRAAGSVPCAAQHLQAGDDLVEDARWSGSAAAPSNSAVARASRSCTRLQLALHGVGRARAAGAARSWAPRGRARPAASGDTTRHGQRGRHGAHLNLRIRLQLVVVHEDGARGVEGQGPRPCAARRPSVGQELALRREDEHAALLVRDVDVAEGVDGDVHGLPQLVARAARAPRVRSSLPASSARAPSARSRSSITMPPSPSRTHAR